MTKRILFATVLAGLIAALAAFTPSSSSAPQGHEEDTQLALYMKDINQKVKKLRSSLKEAGRNEESLAEIRALQILVTNARGEKPTTLKDVPEADRPAFVADFQRQMVDFAMKLLELESAVIDGDNATAQEAWKTVNGVKSPAHEKFKVKD